jgi:hypothetical protein
MRERWSVDQVTAIAPDPSSLSAGRGLAHAAKWLDRGVASGPPDTIWGLCRGSGSKPYQICVDVVAPAFKCSCPSRKIPCKHALGLLFMWAAGDVAEPEPPAWVVEWIAGRAQRAAKAQARKAEPAESTEAQRKAAARRAAQRGDRVAAGVVELGQWLDDQVRQGLAGLDRAGYQHWDGLAARLVDAQAPGLARSVRALAGVASSGEGWDERLLAEFGLLRLLTRAYERIDALPPPLADSVRSHVGFTVPSEQVLAGPPVRDVWHVLGSRDEMDERMTTRRVWLRGRDTGRPALVLSFAMAGAPLARDLAPGVEIEADLCFYPGASPLRALVGIRHEPPRRLTSGWHATTWRDGFDAYARALASDPWIGLWPMTVRGVIVPGDPWRLIDVGGDSVRLVRGVEEPWTLCAAAGGRPAPISGEWSPSGFRPLAVRVEDEVCVA